MFEDESGVSQKPPVRRTWSPVGRTPALEHRFSWQNLSVAAFLCYRWDNRRHDLMFRVKPGGFGTGSLTGVAAAFMRQMGRLGTACPHTGARRCGDFCRGAGIASAWSVFPRTRRS